MEVSVIWYTILCMAGGFFGGVTYMGLLVSWVNRNV